MSDILLGVPYDPLITRQLAIREEALKNRLAYSFDTEAFFQHIDNIHQLIGAAVIYIDKDFTATELRPFRPICHANKISIILKETLPLKERATLQVDLESPSTSKLIGESAGMVLSCGAAVKSWVVVLGSGGAAPITGGTSTAVTVLAYSAAAASSVQYFNS